MTSRIIILTFQESRTQVNWKWSRSHTLVHCFALCSKLPQTKQGFLRLAEVQLTAVCPSSPQL